MRDVIIDGAVVMRGRQLLEIDEREVMAKVREIARGISRGQGSVDKIKSVIRNRESEML